jgi:hypothetical protein
MPGFKTFASGDILTAADVNDFLMKQSVITCESTTRPASPVEGMVVYETDLDVFSVYSGSAWVRYGNLGAWTPYTPTWTATTTNPTIGNGTLTGAYAKFGRSVDVRIRITVGSTTTVGSGVYFVGLPVAASANVQTMTAVFYDASAGFWYSYIAYIDAGASIQLIRGDGTTAQWAHDAPVTPATGDALIVTGTYEASS